MRRSACQSNSNRLLLHGKSHSAVTTARAGVSAETPGAQREVTACGRIGRSYASRDWWPAPLRVISWERLVTPAPPCVLAINMQKKFGDGKPIGAFQDDLPPDSVICRFPRFDVLIESIEQA